MPAHVTSFCVPCRGPVSFVYERLLLSNCIALQLDLESHLQTRKPRELDLHGEEVAIEFGSGFLSDLIDLPEVVLGIYRFVSLIFLYVI